MVCNYCKKQANVRDIKIFKKKGKDKIEKYG